MAESAHFKDWELRCKGRDCCGRQNLCVPELLTALELLRSAIALDKGRELPVIVLSGYRCQKHNKSIGGAPASIHIEGKAADIRVPGMTAAELERIARTIPGINGIGRDDYGNDLHVDVRDKPAQWCYASTGGTVKYYKAA